MMFIKDAIIKKQLLKQGYDEGQASIIINSIKRFGPRVLNYFEDEILTSEQIFDVIEFIEYDDKMQQFYMLKLPMVKRCMLIKCYNNLKRSKGDLPFSSFEIKAWRMIFDAACDEGNKISIISNLINHFEKKPLDYEFFNTVSQRLDNGDDLYEILNISKESGMSM